jgi:membrane protease YdiL (CAAX protease family)
MSEGGFYPDGMPHPSRAERRRILLELGVLALGTGLYLGFVPERPLAVDLGMGLFAMGLVGLLARETSRRLWGAPSSPEFDRVRRCTTAMVLVTAPTVLIFLGYGIVDAYLAERQVSDILARLFHWHFFVTLILYVPWALLQQYLFQFYLLARLRALLPYASPLVHSVVNGVLYGLMHLPDWPTALVTMTGGVVWSYSYHRDRYVLPLALSHALIGSTFCYWAYEKDFLARLLPWLGQ